MLHIDYMINIMLFYPHFAILCKICYIILFLAHFDIPCNICWKEIYPREPNMTTKWISWKWSRSLSTLESDIQNDYVSDEEYEEVDNDMELDEGFLNRSIW